VVEALQNIAIEINIYQLYTAGAILLTGWVSCLMAQKLWDFVQ